ncbi:MAG: glycosyltransferase family 2 protein [Planctomycetota bacterium]
MSATTTYWVLAMALLLSTLYWLRALWHVLLTIRCVPILQDQRPPEPNRWPKLSLIIPACNEADHIEKAVKSRLRDDYPNLEIILINDRSTDETGAIINRLAAQHAQIQAIHIRDLPEGWLGKVHAQHVGESLATGDWLLFSDADVHFTQGTMRRAIAFCLERGADHLAIFPEIWRSSFLLDVGLATAYRLVCALSKVWSVADPASDGFIGIGAFNLVSRQAFDRAGGFEKLQLEVIDDVGLGRILKQSGAKSCPANGKGLVGLYLYRSMMEAARGAEKSAIAGAGFSAIRLFALCTGLFLAECGPFIGLLLSFWGLPASPVVLASLGVTLAVTTTGIHGAWLNGRIVPSLLAPLGTIFVVTGLLRSGWLAIYRGGLLWRGTLYPLSIFRDARRIVDRIAQSCVKLDESKKKG